MSGALRRRMRRPQAPLNLAAVTGAIHPDDDMHHPEDVDGTHYARVGRSAVDAIERALAAADRGFADVESCLDMPCGYGRVLRLLALRDSARAHHGVRHQPPGDPLLRAAVRRYAAALHAES